MLPVVHAAAEDNLHVHMQAGFIKKVKIAQRIAGETVFQHPDPKFGLRRVHRDIHRLHPVTDNALDVALLHIGQGYIVALKKGQTGIVILEIQGFPHAFRHLVDETENTGIRAAPVITHQVACKDNPKVLIGVLFDLKLPLLAAGLLDEKHQFLIACQRTPVKDVFDLLPVHREHVIACFDFQFFCNRLRIDPRNQMFHLNSLSEMKKPRAKQSRGLSHVCLCHRIYCFCQTSNLSAGSILMIDPLRCSLGKLSFSGSEGFLRCFLITGIDRGVNLLHISFHSGLDSFVSLCPISSYKNTFFCRFNVCHAAPPYILLSVAGQRVPGSSHYIKTGDTFVLM